MFKPQKSSVTAPNPSELEPTRLMASLLQGIASKDQSPVQPRTVAGAVGYCGVKEDNPQAQIILMRAIMDKSIKALAWLSLRPILAALERDIEALVRFMALPILSNSRLSAAPLPMLG
ncbi:MAG: hypothetical protein QM533_06280 [Cytophagales bacterium]|nr:hypothetical protein [Cytophagales bacterium]